MTVGDIPPLPKWGPGKHLEWAGQTHNFINTHKVLDGTEITWFDSGCGLIPILTLLDGAGGAAAGPGGFKCVRSGANIRVYLGLVSNVLPAGFALGDIIPLTVAPIGSHGYVCLAVTAGAIGDTGAVGAISATIVVSQTEPVDSDPVYFLALGTYGTTTAAGLVVTPGGEGNGVGDQQFELCGGFGGQPKFWKA